MILTDKTDQEEKPRRGIVLPEDEWQSEIPHFGKYVDCDEDCKALRKPSTSDEIKRAYIHWKYHGESCGCSHGC